jgi:hypothetical protein
VQEHRTNRKGLPGVLDIRSDTMTTATLPLSTPLPEARTAAKNAKKGLFARFVDAMIAARMRQAMREIGHHRHLIPDHMLKAAGYETTPSHDGALPFTR